ncbi:MAG TPA: acyltransferase family protein [Actinomycetota bacterium]|nr:acyltransferase family protein [Actinomycetota bacterium]
MLEVRANLMPREGGVQRRHDLDWLRVIAVFLLLPFHSARVFDPFEDFYVHSAETSEALFWSVIAFIAVWQMELLFVLAGAASWYAFGRRTAHEYRRERVKRLLVPFLFGLVVIVPIQSYLAIVWRDGGGSIPAFTADYWTMHREFGGYDGGFTPGHLWFILYLFLYSMVAAPLFARWRARTGPRRWVLWYLALMPLVLYIGDAVPWPEDGPQNLFYSFALFVGGFLLVSEPRLEAAIDDAWRWLTPVAGALIAGQLWLWISGTGERWDTGATSVVLDLWSATVTWVSVLALLALGKRYLSFETAFLRWGNEAAYPIYLLHQSVIIVVAWSALTAFALPALPGFMVVSVGSLLTTVALYELVVKRTNLTRFLFGMKPLARLPREHRAHVPAVR